MAYSFKSNLHRAAQLFYDQLPPDLQLRFIERLKSVDADGNGLVSQAELVQSCRNSGEPLSKMASRLPKLFSVLDMDGNGYLDFDECKSLFFLFTSYTVCDHCGDIILDFSFSCEDCWSLHEAWFDLCLKCYPAMVYAHQHRNFAPRQIVVHRTLFNHLNQVQCVVCGDFHRKDLRGVLIGNHVVMDPLSGEHVCEWCVTWSCSRCGRYFPGVRSSASPRCWLLTGYYCTACGGTGNRTSIAPVIKAIMESNVVQSCSTCRIKANNGTLWQSPAPSTSTSIYPAASRPTSSTTAQNIFQHVSTSSTTAQIFQHVSSLSQISSAIVPHISSASNTLGLAANIANTFMACSIL